MALLCGVLLAFAVGLFATVSGLDRDRAFDPTVAIVIASYYSLFAVMGAGAFVRQSNPRTPVPSAAARPGRG